MKSRLRIALLLLALCPQTALGQSIKRVALGYGVDTTNATWSDLPWHEAVPQIYQAWSNYLLAGRGTELGAFFWSASERSAWPAYDLSALVGTYDDGFAATVLDIRPAIAGETDEYIVKTLIARVTGPDQDIKPVVLIRVYAVREDGRWVFANALPRATRGWLQAAVGQINYVISPDGAFARNRAEDLVIFADSVAARLGVERLPALTYYMANDTDELHRAMGVEWTFGATGPGYALAGNRIILSGSSVFGEGNRHEVVHILMAPLLAEGRTHPIINEGLATWLGGTQGLYFEELMKEYAAYLRSHPGVTVDAVLEGASVDQGWYPTGAVLARLAYERGGFEGVKDLFMSGPSNDDLRSALARILGMDWAQINARVRTRVLELAESG